MVSIPVFSLSSCVLLDIPSQVRSRLFCCCLPVRFGVFSMSILYFALGGLIAASGFLQLKDQDAFKALVPRDKTALILNTVMYSLLALVSILGFIGAIAKSRNCIAVYRTVLSLHLGFSIATGVVSHNDSAYLVRLFITNSSTSSHCSIKIMKTIQSTFVFRGR